MPRSRRLRRLSQGRAGRARAAAFEVVALGVVAFEVAVLRVVAWGGAALGVVAWGGAASRMAV
ncbi:MAG: hypothetical protein SYR96_30235 [Actinomycetota bacterium]|nr:hypothetical protein [Actinomycetota bacterium]